MPSDQQWHDVELGDHEQHSREQCAAMNVLDCGPEMPSDGGRDLRLKDDQRRGTMRATPPIA
jgi:hypothetical protein